MAARHSAWAAPVLGSTRGLVTFPAQGAWRLPSTTIVHGDPVGACAFPATVALSATYGFTCSGTLVHPEVVVYASHCGDDIGRISFGEDVSAPARVVTPAYCSIPDDADVAAGLDFAYCRLNTPVKDVPITPIIMGCEVDELKAGKSIVVTGFGRDSEGGVGIKHAGLSVVHGVRDGLILTGGQGHADNCFGDSGGSSYVQLADGTWRVFSITSFANSTEDDPGDDPYYPCGYGTFSSLIHNAVPWIERTSGLDVTPCHNARGVWEPGPDCGSFPQSPGNMTGSWDTACVPPAVSNSSTTCGPARDEPEALRTVASGARPLQQVLGA